MITNKKYQRIDKDGYWIEEIEVAPEIEQTENGYIVEYPKLEDAVETEPPPSGDYRWNGEQWEMAEIEIPPYPGIKVMRRINKQGFFVCDEILEPQLIDNMWIYPHENDPDLVAQPVPNDALLYKPKYQNGKWVEGAKKSEIKASHGADWLKFSEDFTASSLDELIANTKNIASLNRFNRLLNAAPNINVPLLCKAWNDCLSGLDEGATTKEHDELTTIINDNNLPLVIGSDCTLSEVG